MQRVPGYDRIRRERSQLPPNSTASAIAVRGVGKTYQITQTRQGSQLFGELLMRRLRHPLARASRERFDALTDITLEVKPGEAVGLIGRNGAGKSTLLKILSRITEPSTGRVEMRGRVGSLLEVGTGFHGELTGRENIFLNGAILGMKRREMLQNFDSIVDFAEVHQFLDTPVKRYSSGMYVRLAFAVAAHLKPDIMIIDEVLAVGDAEFQQRCLGKMDEVAREDGRTVLFVSHNMAAIESFCGRTILLDKGRIVFDGDTREAISGYLSRTDGKGEGAQASTGSFDLRSTDRTDVRGPAILRTLSILGPDGKRTDTVRMGQPMSLVIGVDGLSLPRQAVGVRIKTEVDASVATLNTAMLNPPLNGASETPGEVTLHIPRLALLPGRYWIELTAFQFGYRGDIDRVERAASFQVENADVYGSGRKLDSGHQYGFMYLDGARWELGTTTP